ncbi:MAG: cobalamin biosynthesis protein CobD [Lachnospiraceae bacterium]|nr:cobalamin biosynthesis protein CobD [Lachnospiraceae bacterium]
MNFGILFISHTIAFHLGYLLDMLFGDPHWLPHPVRLIGFMISVLEKIFLKTDKNKSKQDSAESKNAEDGRSRNRKREFAFGILTVLIVLFLTVLIFGGILFLAYKVNIFLGMLVESIMTYQILAAKSLKDESMKVYDALETGTLDDARKAVSMIVGRDTANLSEEGVIKAAVETVAENTSDGVIAPLIYTAIGGPILGFIYKSINTMDSMIGYKNDRYLYFGRAAAKTDDFVNFLPSRISAMLMIVAAFISGPEYSSSDAFKIYKRDRMKHASPNSAQTEAACAGALGLKLAGNASYFGKVVEKPFIGDEVRKPHAADIERACILMIVTAGICESALVCIMYAICVTF